MVSSRHICLAPPLRPHEIRQPHSRPPRPRKHRKVPLPAVQKPRLSLSISQTASRSFRPTASLPELRKQPTKCPKSTKLPGCLLSTHRLCSSNHPRCPLWKSSRARCQYCSMRFGLRQLSPARPCCFCSHSMCSRALGPAEKRLGSDCWSKTRCYSSVPQRLRDLRSWSDCLSRSRNRRTFPSSAKP